MIGPEKHKVISVILGMHAPHSDEQGEESVHDEDEGVSHVALALAEDMLRAVKSNDPDHLAHVIEGLFNEVAARDEEQDEQTQRVFGATDHDFQGEEEEHEEE